MAKKTQLMEIAFPMSGMDVESSYSNQPLGSRDDPRVTTRLAKNVRGFNPQNDLNQGAQRAGLTKYASSKADATNSGQVQDITSITTSKTTLASDGSIDVRTITRLAVADGNIVTFTTSGFTDPAGGTGVNALNEADDNPAIFSQPFFGVVYYVDGAVYKKYTVSSDAVATWSASAGTLPANGSHTARLICAWNGRIVLSGVRGDGHNWFISALNDAGDFDYTVDLAEDVAIAGNNAVAGQPSDIINSLVPYNDDLLYFLCDHSIWMMDGNPAAGGRVVQVSGITGGAWGRPFCRDETGAIYFFGSRGGVYRMEGGQPTSLTDGRVTPLMRSLDMTDILVRAEWNDYDRTAHFWLTSVSGAASTHWVWDRDTDSWWQDTYGAVTLNPTSVHTIDSDDPDDRLILLGCRDSYVRYLDTTAKSDDGTAISSEVWLGPTKLRSDMKFRVDELQAILDDDADFVDFEIYVGSHPQNAYNQPQAAVTGRLSGGHSIALRDRCAGRSMYIRLKNSTLSATWALEKLYVKLHQFGFVEQRRRG